VHCKQNYLEERTVRPPLWLQTFWGIAILFTKCLSSEYIYHECHFESTNSTMSRISHQSSSIRRSLCNLPKGVAIESTYFRTAIWAGHWYPPEYFLAHVPSDTRCFPHGTRRWGLLCLLTCGSHVISDLSQWQWDCKLKHSHRNTTEGIGGGDREGWYPVRVFAFKLPEKSRL
jgi:hypothetical protein